MEEGMKKYICRRIDSSLVIDGNLGKPEWKAAEKALLVDTVTGLKPMQATIAGLLWNDNYLYVGFQYEDDYVFATMTGYNERLYEEDVVEVFLDDDRDMKTYIEIEVNPLNALLHYNIHNNLDGRIITFARVDKTVDTAVHRDTQKGILSVEIAIPFFEFAKAENLPPKKGDRWLFNLYRIDRLKDGGAEYSAWSPTGLEQFHRPEKFGELVFQ